MNPEKCYIIAEIGVNHNGSFDTACKLIDVAKECGANAVKFQTFKASLLANKNAPVAEYQKQNTSYDSQHEMLSKLELSTDTYHKIKEYCTTCKIEFISTPFDIESVDLLNQLNVSIFKIGSGDLTNYQLLKKVALQKKKIIISTGMSSLEEVKDAVTFVEKHGANNICILHCISSYPTPEYEVNMLAIKTLQEAFDHKIPIGFSDHTTGSHAAIMAITLGAKYIEKHITLDHNMMGPDHKASLDPTEFKEFCDAIRKTENMLGNGVKKCMPCEEKTKQLVRRSLAVTRDMKENDIITEQDVIALRPDNNISSIYYEDVIGKILTENITKYDFLPKSILDEDKNELLFSSEKKKIKMIF